MFETQRVIRILVALLLSGCAGYRVAGQVEQGRRALLLNRPEEAVSYFQRAVETDPNYRRRVGRFGESAWTYLGRAQYHTGKLAEARQSLERAVSEYPDDDLARLYLGLMRFRTSDSSRGLKEVESALRRIYDTLEYMTYNTAYGQYWDPGREIRKEIEKDLDTFSSKDIAWQKLISSAEWVGQRIEEEMDLARRDERRDRRDRFDRRPGISFGIGF